jgi:hypothetical protein
VCNIVYGQEPRTNYIGNQWYQVNGQPVHYTILIQETQRLRDLAELQTATRREARPTPTNVRADTSKIQKLIRKLRRM